MMDTWGRVLPSEMIIRRCPRVNRQKRRAYGTRTLLAPIALIFVQAGSVQSEKRARVGHTREYVMDRLPCKWFGVSHLEGTVGGQKKYMLALVTATRNPEVCSATPQLAPFRFVAKPTLPLPVLKIPPWKHRNQTSSLSLCLTKISISWIFNVAELITFVIDT